MRPWSPLPHEPRRPSGKLLHLHGGSLMTFAVIPACGRSRRMGRPKLALPVAGRTVLEHVVGALRGGGVANTLVVLGPHVAGLAEPAAAAGAHVLPLPEETPDMRATVEAGLAWLEATFHPAPDDRWLLVPADHPTLDAGVVESLLRAGAAADPGAIVVPTHRGRRGHPTLFAWRHVEAIRSLPAGEGINALLRQAQVQVREVPVSSVAVLEDLDTPEDFERLLRGPGR